MASRALRDAMARAVLALNDAQSERAAALPRRRYARRCRVAMPLAASASRTVDRHTSPLEHTHVEHTAIAHRRR